VSCRVVCHNACQPGKERARPLRFSLRVCTSTRCIAKEARDGVTHTLALSDERPVFCGVLGFLAVVGAVF
jgi:hypothetical protein